MPLQATSGAASYDAFGGGVVAEPNYIESVFSTYLYTGNGSTQTITNGIDLSTKGGLVWMKKRSAANDHFLEDSARSWDSGGTLSTNSTAAQTNSGGYFSVSTTGFSLPTAVFNDNAATYASWTFREQPKFFDVVTYTGDGTNDRNVSHNLGSAPGCYIVKATSTTSDWYVYHRGLASASWFIRLNTTAAQTSASSPFDSAPTSTTFNVWHNSGTNSANASGETYVAYLFAHNAGGFGLTGTDNVISCGGFTSDGSGLATINLGYEPQWVLLKKTDSTASWYLFDTMRGMTMVNDAWVFPDISDAEGSGIDLINPTATGFTVDVSPFGWQDSNLIYIAIRRGPMKVPSTGTSVFGLSARTGTGANATVTGGQTDDTVLIKNRGAAQGTLFASRLTATRYLLSSSDAAQATAGTTILQANPWDVMDGVKVGTTSAITNASSNTFINYLFKRAPSFHDVVCYTGDGTNGRSITHNLTVAPELIFVKERSNIDDWAVYSATYGRDYYAFLNFNYDFLSFNTPDFWGTSGPTTTAFGVSNNSSINQSARTYIAYLFATCAGVSKVGSYTGTATTKQIDCGFTSGARFVMIKRGDSSGDWYVWDTARGIVAGNDQYFLLNTTAAEVTNTDYIDTYSAGFEISSTAPAAINASGGTFVFLAIA
jgi:hypothetical protein